MTMLISQSSFKRTALVLGLSSVFMPTFAQTGAAQGSVSVGIGVADGSQSDRALFSQYSGMRSKDNVGATVGVDYSLRQEESSTWVDFQASDLLGDMRELSLVWKNTGNWKFTADYSDLVRNEPYQVNTGLRGVGGAAPQVVTLAGGVGTGVATDLESKRSKLGLGFTKIISPRMQFSVDLKTENKVGSRLFGVGMNCPTVYDPACGGTTGIAVGAATLMMPEPLDSNHSQIEARLSYALEKLRFSLGYYGSFYRNGNTSMNPVVADNLYNPVGGQFAATPGLLGYLNQPVSLAPDNQSHQVDLTGLYNFTNTTRATFKLAYASAAQDDGFAGPSRTGLTSLNGKVNTTLAQIGIASRPLPKLSLQADVRYQDRDDETVIAYYNVAGTMAFTNHTLPNRKTNAKLQGSWQFTPDYKGTLGADFESIDRGVFTATSAVAGLSALRQNTDETTWRAELRRRMSENLSGAVTLSHSRRDGSSWLKDNSGLGVTAVTNPFDPAVGLTSAIFMPTLADRQRDKVKLFVDWMPNKDLTLQINLEEGTDKFSTPSAYGLHETRMTAVSLDWSYAISFRWGINGYLSQSTQTFNQTRDNGYLLAFENQNSTVGFGVTGRPINALELGGTLSYTHDNNQYSQALSAGADAYSMASLAASGGLPDVTYQQTALKLFGKYSLDKRSAVRVDFVHQNTNYNDWAWGYNGVPYTYSDGTTLSQQIDQRVNFIGITYVYQLQ